MDDRCVGYDLKFVNGVLHKVYFDGRCWLDVAIWNKRQRAFVPLRMACYA